MPDIVYFNLLDVDYFCIPVSILKLCSGTQLNYGLVLSGLGLPFKSRAAFSQGLIIPITEAKPSEYPDPKFSEQWGFPVWLVGTGTRPGPGSALAAFYPVLSDDSLNIYANQHSAEYLTRCRYSWLFFCTAILSLLLCPESLIGLSAPYSQFGESAELQLCSLPCVMA